MDAIDAFLDEPKKDAIDEFLDAPGGDAIDAFLDEQTDKKITSASMLPSSPQIAATETALAAGTGFLSQIPAGFAGIVAAAGKGTGITEADPGEVVRNVSSALTYEPRSVLGKRITEDVVSPAFEKLQEGIGFLGQKGADRAVEMQQSAIRAGVDSPFTRTDPAVVAGVAGAGTEVAANIAPIPLLPKRLMRRRDMVKEEAIDLEAKNKFVDDLFGEDTRTKQAIHDLRLKKNKVPDYVEPGAGPGTLFQPDAAKQIDIADVTKPDPRLKRDVYRGALEATVQRDMTESGGISLIPDESYKYGESDKPGEQHLRRTSSVNPKWVQELLADTGLSVIDVRSAADKALKGGRLGKRQAQAVSTILDKITSERASNENIALRRDDLAFARENRLSYEPGSAGAQGIKIPLTTTVRELVQDIPEALRKSYQEPGRVATEVADFIGGKAISYLDDVARVSTTAKKLRSQIEHEEFPSKPGERDYNEAVTRERGRYITEFKETLDPLLTKTLGVLKKEDNAALVDALHGETAAPRIKPIVDKLRSILDRFHGYLNKAGLDVGYVQDGYFPRRYLIQKRFVPEGKLSLSTDKGRYAFVEMLTEKHGYDIPQAQSVVDNIVKEGGTIEPPKKKIGEEQKFVSGKYLKTTKTKSEKARALDDIPYKDLRPFLDDNIYDTLTHYFQRNVERAEFARIFGKEGGKLDSLVEKIAKEAQAAKRPLKRDELDRIVNIANALQHNYNRLSPSLDKVNRGLLTYQYMVTLPYAALSSASEILVPLFRGSAKAYLFHGLPAGIKHGFTETLRIAFKGIPKTEATRAAEAAGLAADKGMLELLKSNIEGGSSVTRLSEAFGGGGTKAADLFFRATGLTQLTRFNRVLANEMGKSMAIDYLKDVLKKPDVSKQRKLTELGVDLKQGKAWIERGEKTDDPFYETIVNAGIRFTNDVVVTPHVTNRPLWFSDPRFKLISQIQGFNTTFFNTVVKRQFHEIFKKQSGEGAPRPVKERAENTLKAAMVGGGIVSIAMLTNDIREYIVFGEKGNPKHKGETLGDRIYRALNRTGLSGPIQRVDDVVNAQRYGSSGLQQLLGPQLSQLEEFREGIYLAKEGKPSKLESETVRAIPFVNTNKALREATKEMIYGKPSKLRENAMKRKSLRD